MESIEAPCPHFGICGGCSLQHLSYEEQLKQKEAVVHSMLGDIPAAVFRPIAASAHPFFYRNKMEFSFGDLKDVEIIQTPKGQKPNLEKPEFIENNKIHLGMHPRGRFNLVTPTPSCMLLSKESQVITSIISLWATEFKIPSYVRIKNTGGLRHVLIREGKNTGERLVALVALSSVGHTDELADRLKKCGVPISSFLWMAHDGLSDAVMGVVKKQFWGDPFLHERVGRVSLKVPLKSFLQTNTHSSENLIKTLDQWMQSDQSTDTLFDLYCGVGTLGLNFAHRFSSIIGIEIDPHAIEEAYANAADNHIKNTTFLVGRVEDLAGQLSLHGNPEKATLIVDPPRAGLHSKALEALLKLNFPQIYYVSCNPETLARDLRVLSTKYTINAVEPMDFFPHTDHVETLVKLKKQ